MMRRKGGEQEGQEEQDGAKGGGNCRQDAHMRETYSRAGVLLFQLAVFPLCVFLFLEANVKVVLFGKLRL
eukprot:767072-Hanusia_phi.AAC.3